MSDRPAPPPEEPAAAPAPPPTQTTTPPVTGVTTIPWYRTSIGFLGIGLGVVAIVVVAIVIATGGSDAEGPAEGPTANSTPTGTAVDDTVATSVSSESTSTTVPPTTTSTVGPTTVTVEADGSGDYPDLDSAAAAAAPGSMIILGTGIHVLAGTLSIDGDLTITGSGSAGTEVVSSIGPLVDHGGDGSLTLAGITFRYEGTDPSSVLAVTDATIAFTDIATTGGVWDEDGISAKACLFGGPPPAPSATRRPTTTGVAVSGSTTQRPWRSPTRRQMATAHSGSYGAMTPPVQQFAPEPMATP